MEEGEGGGIRRKEKRERGRGRDKEKGEERKEKEEGAGSSLCAGMVGCARLGLARDRRGHEACVMRDHRQLEAWKVSRAVALGVLSLARTQWRPWAAALFGQLQRASLSVPLNTAEGYAFGPSPTYRRHLGVAYGSCVETVELLELAAEAGLLPADADLLTNAHHSRRLLIGLLRRYRPMGLPSKGGV